MAVFTIDVATDKAESGVASLSTEVGALSKEFDALQASLRAAEAEMNAIGQLQQQNLAAWSKGQTTDAMRDGGFDWQAAQKKALGQWDQHADAQAGRAKMMSDLADAQRKAAGSTNQFSAETFAATAATQGLTAAMGPYGQAVQIVIDRIKMVANAIYDLVESAVRFTQEKDALRATFDAFTGGGGQAMLDGLEDLAAQLPFTADKLNVWAKSLLAAGIQGEALKTSIRAIAAATAIMGEGGGQAAMTLIKRFAMMAESGQKVTLDRRILSQLAEAGVSVQALAKALGVPAEKLGKMSIGAKELGDAMQKALVQQGAKPLEVMGQSVASIAAKLKEGWEDAFEDLGEIVGPFMAELQSLASEFFAGSVASGTLKSAIKTGLTPMFKAATTALYAMHIALLKIEIAYLKAKIAIAPLTSALGKVVSAGDVATGILMVLGAVLGAVAIVAGICAAAMFLVALPFIIFGGAVIAVIVGLKALIDYVGDATGGLEGFNQSVRDTISNVIASIYDLAAKAPQALADFTMSALAAGGNFVLGLVQALLTGQGPVADAAKALALRAKNAIFGALGISSPSKVMLKAGGFTAQGLAMGIDAGADDVEAAARGNAQAAVDGATGAPGRAGASGGGGGGKTEIHLHVHEGGIVLQGGNVLDMTVEALALALEQVRARAGLAPAPAGGTS